MINYVKDLKISQIFSIDDKTIYQIPKYQRKYTWGQNEWNLLFNDIIENNDGYFLGSSITVSTNNNLLGNRVAEVIDGQQRLTTLSIAFAALYSRIAEFKQDLNEDELNDLINIKKALAIKNENIVNYVGYYFKTYKGLINFLYDQLRNFTNQFNNYLLAEVLPNIGNKKYNFPLAKGKTIRVLNFNYTDTYAKLYNPHSIYAEENPKYIYVHGKVCDSKNCNLILGTHSFYNNLPNDLNEEINVEFNVFKKHNQRHRYGTIEPYQELLKELNDRRKIIVPSFHIIGHSLDKSDHNILRHIFKAREKCNIYIYYHNQKALNRLINNITEIIGEEEVMTKVKFIDQEDKNRGVFKPSQESSLITT